MLLNDEVNSHLSGDFSPMNSFRTSRAKVIGFLKEKRQRPREEVCQGGQWGFRGAAGWGDSAGVVTVWVRGLLPAPALTRTAAGCPALPA